MQPASSAPLTGFWRHCAGSIRRTFADHVPLYVCAAAFCAATVAIAIAYRIPLPFDAATIFLIVVPQFVLLGFGLGMAHQLALMAKSGFPAKPSLALMRWTKALLLDGERPGNIFHTLVVFTPLMICFAALKDQIPHIHPFAWDQTFAHWSRFIGFGRYPWQWLQPIFGTPAMTAALSLLYDVWFVLMFGSLILVAFAARNSRLRMQFLLAFAFEWFIAGNVLAAVLSSAGPCFYGFLVHGPNPYAAQMAYLHRAAQHWPVWSVWTQNLLWTSYKTGMGDVAGISAMPSMHVTSTTLMAIMAWRVNRKLGVAMWIYTVLIVIASIHLAWHYAVDGIAGLVLAFAFWRAAEAVLRLFAARARALPAEAPAY